MTETSTPDVEAAYQRLFVDVHAPAFFEKLAADFGIRPENERQAAQLLDIGEKLWSAQQEINVKEAAANTDWLTTAASQLDQSLTEAGLQSESNQADYQQKAAAFADNPQIKSAVLAFQNHLLQQADELAASPAAAT